MTKTLRMLVVIGLCYICSFECGIAMPDEQVARFQVDVVAATYDLFLQDLAAKNTVAVEDNDEPYRVQKPPSVLVQYVSPDSNCIIITLPTRFDWEFLADWTTNNRAKRASSFLGLEDVRNDSLIHFTDSAPMVLFYTIDETTSVVCYSMPPKNGKVYARSEKATAAYYALELKSIENCKELAWYKAWYHEEDAIPNAIRLSSALAKEPDSNVKSSQYFEWLTLSNSPEQQAMVRMVADAEYDMYRSPVTMQSKTLGAASELYLFPPLSHARAYKFTVSHQNPEDRIDLADYELPYKCELVSPVHVAEHIATWQIIEAGLFELRNGSVQLVLFEGSS